MATQPAQTDALTAAVLGPDVIAKQLQQQQAAAYAKALMEQGMQQPQGGMVGNHYVAPSWTQGLAGALKMYMGRKMLDDLPAQQAELARQQSEQMYKAFGIGAQPTGAPQFDGPQATGQPSTPEPMYKTLPGRSPQESATTALAVGIPEYMKILANQLAPTADASRARELGIGIPQQQANYNAEQFKKGFIEPMNVRPGGTVYDAVTKQPIFNAPDKGMQIVYGASGPVAQQVPGAAETTAAMSTAQASGPAQFDMVTIDTPEGKKMVTRAQAAQMSGGISQPNGLPTPNVVPAPAGKPAASTPGQNADALAILRQELVKAQASGDMESVAALQREIARLPANASSVPSPSGLKTPGIPLQDDAARQFGNSVATKSADALLEARDKARAASDDLINISEARKAIAGGAYQGTGANAKLAAVKFAGAFGIQLDPEKAANTDYLKSVLGAGLLQQAKALGANPSNADAERINEIVGSIGKDAKAMQRILDWRETMARRTVDSHNRSVDQAVEGGLKLPFDLRVKLPSAPAAPAQAPAGFKIIGVTGG